ncbi:MAG: hypothetical protein KJN60_08985 [Boseongicola sp.]|nr:hypothetical protein [Boseongicola sp.]
MVGVEPIDEHHLKYIWAAYRMGGLEKLGIEDGISSSEFPQAFTQFLMNNYHAGWVISAPTHKGVIPVGMIFGQVCGPMILIGDFTWFGWASKRNIIEATATYFRQLKEDVVLIMYVASRDREFFDYMKQLGLLRSIGRVHDILDEPAMLYQTRREQWAY